MTQIVGQDSKAKVLAAFEQILTAQRRMQSRVATKEEEASAEEEEELPEFDIQLRETLRIITEAIKISPNPVEWSQPALPIASKSRFERLLN